MDRRQQRGSTIIEFTLVGIPLIFVLFSIFEVARGMWIYTTLAHAVREGNRYAIVHGNNCSAYPNSCTIRVRDVALRIRADGVGLIPDQMLNVQLISSTRTITCPTLQQCIQGGALGDNYWPGLGPGVPSDAGANRFAPVQVRAQYPFRSAIAMFWPGAGRPMGFGTFLLPASSRERIQY